MIAEAVVPLKNPRLAARVHEGEALVIVLDRRELHRLNDVGTRIWELCDGRSVGAIIDAVVNEFDVSREVASNDVAAFLRSLEQTGALQLESKP